MKPKITSALKFPAWHQEVLAVREKALNESKEKLTDWDEAKAALRAELKK
jgi:hypothetical protein